MQSGGILERSILFFVFSSAFSNENKNGEMSHSKLDSIYLDCIYLDCIFLFNCIFLLILSLRKILYSITKNN